MHFVLKYGQDDLSEARLTEMLTFANAAAALVTTRRGDLRDAGAAGDTVSRKFAMTACRLRKQPQHSACGSILAA